MWIVCIILGLIIALLIYGYCLNFFLKEEFYTIDTDKVNHSFRIVFITDLHGNRHGKNNNKLLQMIENNTPDVIAVAGDLIVKDGKGEKEAVELLHYLAKKYPVFYAPGNHEVRLKNYSLYKNNVQKTGTLYLENAYEEMEQKICFAGLDLPLFWYHKCYQKRNMSLQVLNELLPNFEKKGKFTILIAHNPEYFPVYEQWGADLVLSGHVHGGIMKLPFLGGVIAPSLRLFPKYDSGRFDLGKSTMILSRGLGLHDIKLRFFNRPELSIIDIHKKNS